MENLPLELIAVISSFQDKVSDVSKLRRTCKCFYSLLQLTRRESDNDILILLQLFPNRFNIEILSLHGSITWDIVCKYPEYNWNFEQLSLNRNITFETIDANIHKPWSLKYLACREDFPLWFYYKYQHLNWDETNLKNNTDVYIPDISNDIFHEGQIKDKSFETMSMEELNRIEEWNMCCVSSNCNINWNFVKLHIDKGWNWYELSGNPGITEEDIFNNLHHNWIWPIVSYSKNISWEEIHNKVGESAYEIPYFVNTFAMLTPEFIESHPELGYLFDDLQMGLASNLHLPITYIIDRLKYVKDKDRIILRITARSDFTWDLVFKYPEYEWNFENVEN